MILKSDAVLKRASAIMLVFFVWAFLGQAVCALHASHLGFPMGAGMDHPTAQASASMPAHGQSQHGEHPSAPGESHSGACAQGACGSAVTATAYHGIEAMSRDSNNRVPYLGGIVPPEAEMIPPPPRLG